MVIDVQTLLTLPSSKAFSSFRPSIFATSEDVQSRSPPRKTPRLAEDSDSASASRSRDNLGNDVIANDGKSSVVVKLSGSPIKPRPDNFYNAHFSLAKASVHILLNDSGELPATYEKIYSACKAVVCDANRGEGLYESFRLSVEQCIMRLSTQLLARRDSAVEWLGPFVEACEWFEKQVNLLQSLLAYLDRQYIPNHKNLTSIKVFAYGQFALRMLENPHIISRIQAGIREWSQWERIHEAEHEHRAVIPKLVSRLVHHHQYTRIFEEYYLNISKTFYIEESAKLRKSASAKRFFARCYQWEIQERQRTESVLPASSWDIVKDTILRAQLVDKGSWLAKEALPLSMDEKSFDLLGRMYTMFSAVDDLKTLLEVFKEQIEVAVRKIVNDTKDEELMVPRLLEFKAFGDKLVSSVFVNKELVFPAPSSQASTSTLPADVEIKTEITPNKDFGYALIDSFQKGFKTRRNKPAELIAKYIDKAMRKGQKGREDKDYSAELDAALSLYRFTDDKDVFRTFYQRALAKRLLLEKSASDDHEKAMLKKLKEQYDPEFGMGDHMFTDLALSRELMKDYTDPRGDKGAEASTHKLSVMVLQRSVWPFTARQQDVALPEWMGEELQSYMNFYKKKHSGHKLDWDHSLGTATLRARLKAGDKELSVSLYQAIVLLLFNEDEQRPFSEIKLLTQMDDAELRRTLQSLACGKKRVLRKQPPGRDVNDGDVFMHNADFTDPAFRVHINSIQVKETVEEAKRTQSLIEGDRRYALDAAIVRIMKGKKQLHYEQLKTATIEAVKNHFKPDIPMIKQRIDSLVEQDYLKRDEDDMHTLMYVA